MKKRNRDLTKAVLRGMLWGGMFTVAAIGSPTFTYRIFPKLVKCASYKIKNRKRDRTKFYNTFYYLKNKSLINFDYRGKQIYISLSEEGKKLAKKYQIDDLKIERPKRWDGKWRILIFDIEDRHKIKREALRGKIKQLGLYQYQKSVWIFPFDFRKEINLLREFFGFKPGELKIVIASEIEDKVFVKEHFGIR